MRKQLSMMIMEGPDDKIAIELYKDGHKALEAFSNLKGNPGDRRSRATFLLVDQESEKLIHYEKKDLPEERKEEPWGHQLGKGPIEPEDLEGGVMDVSSHSGHSADCGCEGCGSIRKAVSDMRESWENGEKIGDEKGEEGIVGN